MATSSALDTGVLTDAVRERSRAEAREVMAMLGYRDDEMVRTSFLESPMRRQIERSAIPMSIGEATGLSEGQVQLRLSSADTVRDQSPITWDAFREGLIDVARVRDIAHTIDALKRAESIHRLDSRVIGYAVGHTGAELRAWLRRFVLRVEADLAAERADEDRAKRHVSFSHTDDSMGWLNAYLPSHQLAAIEARLRKESRHGVDPDDDRTIGQREADLLVAWCTSSEAATIPADANIAVTIDADVLAGAVAGFAASTDGRWAAPAGWITDLARTGNTFWHRMVLDPVTGDVLSHEYVGRFCPDILNVALQFRDSVCQAPGCMVPAGRCDMDHRIPYPDGPTTAANLGPLCRRHHQMKGHGILRWSTRPPDTPKAFVIEIYNEPVHVEYAAAA